MGRHGKHHHHHHHKKHHKKYSKLSSPSSSSSSEVEEWVEKGSNPQQNENGAKKKDKRHKHHHRRHRNRSTSSSSSSDNELVPEPMEITEIYSQVKAEVPEEQKKCKKDKKDKKHRKHRKKHHRSSSSSSTSSSSDEEDVEKRSRKDKSMEITDNPSEVNASAPEKSQKGKKDKKHRKHRKKHHRSSSSSSTSSSSDEEDVEKRSRKDKSMEITDNPSEVNAGAPEKSQKSKKDKKRRKKRHRSSSSSSTSSSSDEEVEKRSRKDKKKRKHRKKKRHSSTSSCSSSSDSDHKRRHRGRKCHRKRRHSSTSSSTSSSSSDSDDCRKKKDKKNHKNCRKGDKKDKQRSPIAENHPEQDNQVDREEWMNLPTNFLSESNLDRRREKEEQKKRDQEKQQYNPRECARELNPYWKNGGDGLPKFQKPSEDLDGRYEGSKSRSGSGKQSWRKTEKIYPELPESDFNPPLNTEKAEPDSTVPSDKNDEESEIITEKELNALAAKLVKAEIMGNTKLIDELKEKLDTARKSIKSQKIQEKDEEEAVILTHTDSKGVSRPLKSSSDPYGGKRGGKSEKKKRMTTHDASGDRIRYFADDDKYSLKEMFENEKYNTTETSNNEFIKMAGKSRKNDDLDDVFSDNIRKKESDGKKEARDRDRAIADHKKLSKSLDNCNKCLQSKEMQKHLMISMNETVYVALPAHEPLTENHCLIIPIRHVSCSTQLDENEFEDLRDVQKALIRMFQSQNLDCVFFEVAMNLHRYPHMVIECIPLEKEEGDMAPIYFKKAIDESETEWAQNKKLVPLRGKTVKRAIPKGLPYFAVTFGLDDGYAHVIEDEQMFPANFAQEIIGGMLDLHHSKWRKPKKQRFEEQKKRVLDFSKLWSPFDCTKA